MNTVYRSGGPAGLSVLLLLCVGNTLHAEEARSVNADMGFSSLASEQAFWREWIGKNYGTNCSLRSFLPTGEADCLTEVNKRLAAIDSLSSIFLLVIRANTENGDFEIVSLSRDTTWQLLRWKDDGAEGLKESVDKAPEIEKAILDNLSREGVFVDGSDSMLDADSVYVFLKFEGKCSRFAIYNPQFQPGIRPPGESVADSLKLLLKDLGIVSPDQHPSELFRQQWQMRRKDDMSPRRLAAETQEEQRHRDSVEKIEKLGGHLWYDDDSPPRPLPTSISVSSRENRSIAAILELLRELTGLRGLILGETDVTDAGLECLEGLTQLETLELCNTQVTDAGLERLGGLTQLRDLRLSGTRVTDAGVDRLKGLTGLRHLRLDDTQVTDAGLRHLRGLTQLRELDLRATGITDAGLQHLNGLSQLRQLFLGGTQITDAGLEQLRHFTQLQDLRLEQTRVTDDGLRHLGALARLEVLTLGGTRTTDAGVEHLKALTQLQALCLPDTQVTGAGLKHLTSLARLDSLNLVRTQVTDSGLQHLTGLTELREIFLAGTQVTDAGLQHLQEMHQLRWVILGEKVTDEGVNKLQHALPNCEIER